MTYLGVPLEHHASIGSTNDEAFRRAAEGAPEGLVVSADEQTAGRGRMGRSWWDKPGCSTMFSLLLRPGAGVPLPRWPLYGIAMACAVAEAGSEAAGAALDVKWPNDVLHGERKVCGILAESRVGALVVGVGINVNQVESDFPDEIRARAGSLRIAAGGRVLSREALLEAVLGRFERYRRLAGERGADALFEAVRPRLPGPGARLVVRSGEQWTEGALERIEETGALLLRRASDGALVAIAAGELV